MERAHRQAQSLLEQSIAEARVEAQALRLRRRERLIDQVFAEAAERLASAASWPDYRDIALALVREAVGQIDSDEMVVQADQGTRQVLTQEDLAALGQELGMRLRHGDALAKGSGILVATPDGHRRFDNTLEARLTRLRDRLRTPVYQILMGERP
jgi:vacuolar-type H+-ATPase subunit E/Vma4